MNRIDEIHAELKKLLGYDCVIVKLATYNQDVATFHRHKKEIEKYRDALEEIMEAKNADDMRDIAEDAL